MDIIINLEFLKNQDLSPNEYVTLYLIHLGEEDQFPLNKNINSLIEKKYLTSSGKLNVDKEFFQQQKQPMSSWINEWLSLWPKHLLPTGYRVSGNSLECKKRMLKFLKNFPDYSPDIIIKATKSYLTNQEKQNWAYTKKNSKFIFDNETSTLEQECEALLNNSEKVSSNTVDL